MHRANHASRVTAFVVRGVMGVGLKILNHCTADEGCEVL